MALIIINYREHNNYYHLLLAGVKLKFYSDNWIRSGALEKKNHVVKTHKDHSRVA